MEYILNIIKIMQNYWYLFLVKGVGYTLLLSVITVFFGSIVGIIVCIGHMCKIKPINWVVDAFVAVIRGTPMLLQLYVGYFLVPKLLPFDVSDFLCICVALILNSGAYVSEVFRSGIEAVDRGQTEAARSLGLNASQTMMKIILPQAIKNILPALGNEFIMIVKDTSLASTFFVGEVMTQYLIVKGKTYLTMECLFIEAAIYFVLTFILTKLLGIFERRLHAND